MAAADIRGHALAALSARSCDYDDGLDLCVRAWPVDLAVLCDPSAYVPIEGSLLARSIGNWHGTMEWSLFLVIGAHVATAMAHTLIFRDRIMQRMLPEKPTVGRTKGLKPEVVAISPQKRQDGSAFTLTYILRLRSCKSMDAFVISSLPSPMLETLVGRATSLRGHYSASSLLRTQPPPSRLRPTSRYRRLYGLPCSDDFAPGRGGLLQLLSMSLSPCCRFHPAEVNIRIGQSSAAHAAFALRLKARPSGILIFEATMRSLLLRPDDS
jgi:hypothetical protein